MKNFGLTAVAGMLFFVSARAGDESAMKKEFAAVQGKWTVIKLEADEKVPADFKMIIEFLKDGRSVEFKTGDIVKKVIVELNPAARPKTITFFPEERDRVMLGIYKIEKSVLTICITENFRDGRPTEFALKKGKSFGILTAERAK
jgi:uncharacterized protein (TIGR03067 family)